MVGHVDVRVNHNEDHDDFPDLEYAQGFQLPTKTCRSRRPRHSSGDRQRRLKNKFGQLDNTIDFEELEVSVNTIEAVGELTRLSAMNFNEADVKKPLASAVEIAKAGNSNCAGSWWWIH